jgi:hypothetical protein
MEWILMIVLSNPDLMVPVAAFRNEQQCLRALDQWELEPGVRIVCQPGEITEEKDARPRHRKRRRSRDD